MVNKRVMVFFPDRIIHTLLKMQKIHKAIRKYKIKLNKGE